MRNPRPHPFPMVAAVVVAVSLAVVAGAEPRLTAPLGESPWHPMVTPAQSLTLAEAVDLALQADPARALAHQRSMSDEGVLLENTGLFDTSFQLDTSIRIDRTLLNDGELQQEKNKRIVVRAVADAAQLTADALAEQLASDEGLIFYNCPAFNFDTDNDPTTPPVEINVDILDLLVCYSPEELAYQELVYNLSGAINYDELQEEIIQANRDIVQQSFDIFDEVARRARSALRTFGLLPLESETTTYVIDASFVRAFRNGMVFQPGIRLEATKDTYRGKPTEANFGGKGIPDTIRSTVSLNLDIPLGKGRGTVSTGASERAAAATWNATLATEAHTASMTITRVTLAYWNLVAAQERIKLLESSFNTATQVRDLGDQLVEADEIVRADLSQMRARVSETRAQMLQGRQTLVEARIALADAIGLEVRQLDDAPLAAETFPEMPPEAVIRTWDELDLAALGLSRRGDLAASRLRVDSAKVLAEAARADLKRRVDLTLNLSWRGLSEGLNGESTGSYTDLLGAYGDSLLFSPPGPSGKVMLRFDLPFGNNVAEGQLEQNTSLEYQSRINESDLERQIRIAVENLRRSVVRAAREVNERQGSVDAYGELLGSQIERFRLSEATVVETIQTQQEAISSDLSLISAKQRFFTLLSRLRFETGSLVDWKIAEGHVLVRNPRPFEWVF